MVIVMNMQSGEIEAFEAADRQSDRDLLTEAGWSCPTQEPQPPLDERRQVLPALMEHVFSPQR